jgi:3D (Asp-Asp-Asp) domain-containing protein
VLTGVLLGLVVPGAGGAGSSAGADALRSREVLLAHREHSALLDLYAIDTGLARARAQLASLRAREAAVREERAQVAREEEIARAAWRTSLHMLENRLLRLYEGGEPDALSVLLGATSIEEASARLDALRRTARLSSETLSQARSAQHALARVRSELAARSAELGRLVTTAEATAASLAGAQAQRLAFLSSLRHRQRLNAAALGRLSATAHEIAARSQRVDGTPAAASPGASAATPAVGPRALTVTATGYSMTGQTSTGMPVGWGVVSVDPSVIPLGTTMSIPGYGDGVAADTGSGVQGAAIDLWFPTPGQAMAWGRQTLTITLH